MTNRFTIRIISRDNGQDRRDLFSVQHYFVRKHPDLPDTVQIVYDGTGPDRLTGAKFKDISGATKAYVMNEHGQTVDNFDRHVFELPERQAAAFRTQTNRR